MSSDPAPRRIPLSAPHIGGNAWAYVKECLDTGWVSSAGAFVDGFQARFAERLGGGHAVATASGTSALHLALLALGVRPGDEVVTSTLTFIAPVNAIRYCGATPVLVDADSATWQMDAGRLTAFLERVATRRDGQLVNRESRRPIRALLPVHVLGNASDLDAIMAVAERFGLPVLEDATESLGSLHRGRPLGTIGAVGCFSFNGNKLMTTGAGGLAFSRDAALAGRIRHLSTQAKLPGDDFEHDELGYNYRMSNMQAALGVAQLELLDHHIADKARIAARYDEAFGGVDGITLQRPTDGTERCFWLYTIRLDGRNARPLIARLKEQGIESRPLWQAMHLSRVHADCPREGGDTAAALVRECISLPCSVGLEPADQDRVIQACLSWLAGHSL